MGIPDEPFWAPAELVGAYRAHVAAGGSAARSDWAARNDTLIASPEWQAAWGATGMPGWIDALPVAAAGEKIATRKAIETAINATLPFLPGLVAGAADLTGNTGTKLQGQIAQSADTPGGRQIYYGHPRARHGFHDGRHGAARRDPPGGRHVLRVPRLHAPSRASRIAQPRQGLLRLHARLGRRRRGRPHPPAGRTHRDTARRSPASTSSGPPMRTRPSQAWRDVVEHDGPTALVLSRQNIEVVTDGSAVATGAGIVRDVDGTPDIILVGTGSEVPVCVAAALESRRSGY